MLRRRRSIRLKEYDYSQSGAYFVTIIVKDRACLFGDIIDGEMKLNEFGRVVQIVWKALPERFSQVELDSFVVMPNHIHGVIFISDDVGAIHESPLPHGRAERRKMLLPKVVGYFKMNVAKRVNDLRDTAGAPLWHRNYFEHIIRNEKELDRIRKYIIDNPGNWIHDDENPLTQKKASR